MAKNGTNLIEQLADGKQFLIRHTDKNGKVLNAETFESEKPMEVGAIGKALNAYNRNVPSMRHLWLSVLVGVFASPKLDGYKGKGDKKTGKTAKEFKSSIRDCESLYFAELLRAKVISLPKNDNAEKALQEFATSVREDKNYSNIKSTVSKYYAFVGAAPITSSGYLVPPAVMLAQIAEVMDIDPVDNGLCAQLRSMLAVIEENQPSGDTLNDAYSLAHTLTFVLKGLKDKEDELATHAAMQQPPLPDATKEVIDNAMDMADQMTKAQERKAKAAAKHAAPAKV